MKKTLQHRIQRAKKISTANALIFSSKAAISAVVAYLCFSRFHLPGAIWAPVSAVIVTQEKLHPSIQASLLRIAANLIGAFVGALVSAFVGHDVLALCLAVLITGLVCYFAGLNDAIRAAYAAAVIVTLSSEPTVWKGSMDRVFSVMLGCFAALAVGFVFDRVSRWLPEPNSKSSGNHAE